MKKLVKRIITAMLAASMAVSLFAGCQQETSSSSGTSGETTSGSGETVTIQFYGGGGNPQKYYEWQQNYFEEKIGVRVEAQVRDLEQLQPMVAAGNLPDMGRFTPQDGNINTLIQGNHILDLTPYLDQIPNYAENHPESLQYVKDYKSNGTGKAYCVLTQIGTYNSYPIDVGCYSAAVRWDIYEKAGKPEVTDPYSYLDALAAMKEVYPQTEEGLPTFGICLFPEWDSTELSCWKKWGTINGIMETNIGYNNYDLVNEKICPMMEKGSPYYEALKWLNTAGRMGLLDPDSPTQTYTVSNAKVAQSGQSLSSMWGSYYNGYNNETNVTAEDPKGYMPLIWEGQRPAVVGETKIGNSKDPLCISSTISEEKINACLKFINLMFDEDACMTMYSGPQGELWDIVDGKWQLVDENISKIRQTGEYTFSTGETCKDWFENWGLMNANKHSKYGVELGYGATVEYNEATLEGNKVAEMWSEFYGKERPIEVWTEMDALCPRPEWNNFIEVMPDNLIDLQSNIKSIVTTLSWQMVMEAQSDEEFDAMFDEMISQCKELGLDEIVQWGQDQITKAKEAAAKYE